MSQLFASGSQKIGASASNDYSGLISFRIDWFDLLAVQVTLKSLLQHHSSKVSILPCSAFIVHLSFRYMTTGKTIALTLWSFVGKVMSLLFNILFSVCQSFSPKEQESFNFMAAITILSDFGDQKNKSATVSTVSPSICHEAMGPDAMILIFLMLSFKPTFSLSSFTCALVLLHRLP